MTLLARLRSFWRHVINRSDMEREMSDELAFHIAARADDLTARRGLPRSEAVRLARLEFGSVEKYKEESRQSLGLRLIDEARGDVRYALRTFAKHKAFTAAAIATLALGIGATTAIFSVVDAVMLRVLPVERPEELMSLLVQRQGHPEGYGFTNPLWEAIRDQQDVFSAVFASSSRGPMPLMFGTGDDVSASIQALVASGDFFEALGARPALGRLFTADDDRRDRLPVAVLANGFWRSRFGGSPEALGQTIALNGRSFVVIGVTRPGFFGVNVGSNFDVVIPLAQAWLFDRDNLESRGRWWLNVMGRRKPGVTLERIQARLDTLSAPVMAAALPAGSPASQREFLTRRLVVAPGSDGTSTMRNQFQTPLKVLMALVAVVLLVGSANIASLLLARGATRHKEMATRHALGGSRRRLMRQLMTESVLLAGAGSLLGLAIANRGAVALVRSLSTENNPIFLDLSLGGHVIVFTTTVAVVIVLLIGLLPALRVTRVTAGEAMKTRTVESERPHFRAGKLIVAGQVALSLVLLVSGGLLLRTFVTLVRLDLGFDRTNVVVVNGRPPRIGAEGTMPSPAQRSAAYDEIAERLRALPGIQSVARAFTTPIGDDNWVNTIRVDRPDAPSGEDASCYFNFVGPGYFATMRISLLAGRDFSTRDTRESPTVAIVNETMARRFFPGTGALGQHFSRRGFAGEVEIVGIVRDSKYETVRQATPATAFLPAAQVPRDTADQLVIRTAVTPEAIIPQMQRTARDVNQDLAVTVRTLAAQVDDNLAGERLVASLSGFFAALALLLSMIGLYGVLSYLVTRRQSEFGVRLALGAPTRSVVRTVLSEIAAVLSGGLAVGLLMTLAAVRLLKGLLFGLEPWDGATLAAAIVLLSAMALVAAYLPARRATRLDPSIAMRAE
jgi:predicted permease